MWNPVFLRLNIIISYIFPENFIEFPEVVKKIWRFFLSILTIFILFFGFFWHFPVAKKLMTSAYNRRCQQFFTFNKLYIGCLTIVCIYIAFRLVLLEIRKGEKLPSKRPALLGLTSAFKKTPVQFKEHMKQP